MDNNKHVFDENNNKKDNAVLKNVVLSDKEKFWYERLKEYSKRHGDKEITSWWLRLEYETDISPLNTKQINYILSKLSAKGLLVKTTTSQSTRFSFV